MNVLHLTHDDKPIGDLTENDITLMDPRERKDLIDAAQRHVSSGGKITVEQNASLVRLLIYTRRRDVKDNPRASAAARAAAEVKPASLDDI